MASLLFVCVLFWGAHKSLAPRARTLLGGLGQAMLSFFAVATLLFFFFCECPKFCDLAKQRRKTFRGVSEVGKDDFSLYFIWLCIFFFVFYFSSAAIARRRRCRGGAGTATTIGSANHELSEELVHSFHPPKAVSWRTTCLVLQHPLS